MTGPTSPDPGDVTPIRPGSASHPTTERATVQTGAADWSAHNSRSSALLRRFEGATLLAERPIAKLVGRQDMNPLYHTGPISIFLFIVAFATGLYLTMFYRFGFEASYEAVTNLEANFVGRFIRAAHRYSSIGLVVTSILHGWRTFVMNCFAGARRIAWLSGVSMVAILWVIGVTGYWMIWDERVTNLNVMLSRALKGMTIGLDFLLDHVLTASAGTGWPFLLLLFLIHVGLSIGVAVLIWIHVRKLARPRWTTSPFWTTVIGASVLVFSIAWPLGMLGPIDPSRIIEPIPFDPFFLFLLPLGLAWSTAGVWIAATVLLVSAMFLPWWLRAPTPDPIIVDADRCTGCNLCVVDCPYQALHLIDLEDEEHPHLAVVTTDKCVSCGICVGSCPVKALSFGDRSPETLWDESRGGNDPLIYTCERIAAHSGTTDGTQIVVPCVGMMHPHLLGEALDDDRRVEIVGCPAGDCANREGSTTTNARLERSRVPRLARKHEDADISWTWIEPGPHALADDRPLKAGADTEPDMALSTWRQAAPVVGLVVIVATATIAITNIEFTAFDRDNASLSLSLDHRAGVPLVGFEGEATPTGESPRLVVEVDDSPIFDDVLDTVSADEPDTALFLEDFSIEPGTHRIDIELFDDPATSFTLFSDTVALQAGEVLSLGFRDQAVVEPIEAGRSLFNDSSIGSNAGCRICHSLTDDKVLVGPSLYGLADRAGATVSGQSATQYLVESITDPDAFVVEGFRAGQMLSSYTESLTANEIDYLVAYLLTLEAEE